MKISPQIKLDKLDFDLIRELKINSRRSIRQLAKAINQGPSTVYNRLNRLEETGIIKKWTVVIDYPQLNLDVIYYLCIKIDCEGCNDTENKLSSVEIGNRLKEIDGVCELSLINGEFDILAKLRTHSLNTTASIILDQIRSIPGVVKVVSNNCYEMILQECDIDGIVYPSGKSTPREESKGNREKDNYLDIYEHLH